MFALHADLEILCRRGDFALLSEKLLFATQPDMFALHADLEILCRRGDSALLSAKLLFAT